MSRFRSLVAASLFALAGCGSTVAERDSQTLLFAMIVSAPVWIPLGAMAYTIKSVEQALSRSGPKPEPHAEPATPDRPAAPNHGP